MKRQFLFNLLALLLLATLAACKSKSDAVKMPEGLSEHEHVRETAEPEILYYTCSMHPFIRQDEPGPCPVCGMPLVPKYAEQGGGEARPELSLGRAPVSISEAKLQLIGVKTEAVQRRPLVREIEASGRVAYDPDLYLAQSEYLVARRTGGGGLNGLQGSLVRAARSRLELLGMSDAQIRDLERRGRPQGGLLVPEKGEEIWIYGSLFESDLPWVRAGTPVEVFIPGMEKPLSTAVVSIDPVIDAVTRTAQFRVKVSGPESMMRPGLFVKLKVLAGGETVLAIPDNAMIETGKGRIVYVESSPGHFEPRPVQTGKYGTHFVEVTSGLAEGERVVTNGNFMIDSESSMKGSFSGGHQH
jgi:Cu(I)/Ag(I) efflux system membrane fusion protein